MQRDPAAPPVLDGYTPVRLLGLGGFSDVFLYQQELPRRRVAVKVLSAELTEEVRVAFVREANLMAALSTHPYIVTIHQAGIAGDGRPYLVMEYCSRPSLAERYKRQPLSVADALRTGIRVAGAVATLHSAGILHRDIKPANVLTNDYGWPALTDFGIATVFEQGGLGPGTSAASIAVAGVRTGGDADGPTGGGADGGDPGGGGAGGGGADGGGAGGRTGGHPGGRTGGDEGGRAGSHRDGEAGDRGHGDGEASGDAGDRGHGDGEAHGDTSGDAGAIGLSVPWSPPEMFVDEPDPDVRSDVFSLAATLYTVLAGWTPFEVRGGPNAPLDLIGRIERGAVTPMTRTDLPVSLQAALARGMAPHREDRWPNALDFARALQRVELELGYAPTGIEVPSPEGLPRPPHEDDDGEDSDATRARSMPTVVAQPTAAPAAAAGAAPTRAHGPSTRAAGPSTGGPGGSTGGPGASTGGPGAPARAPGAPTRVAGASTGAPGAPTRAAAPAAPAPVASSPPPASTAAPAPVPTGVRPPASPPAPGSTPPLPAPTPSAALGLGTAMRRSRRGAVIALVIGGLAVLALVAIVLAVLLGGVPGPVPDAPKPTRSGGSALSSEVPAPSQGTAVVAADGTSVTFTWRDPSPAEGDIFYWARSESPDDRQIADGPTATVTGVVPGSRVCIDVALGRVSGRTSPTTRICTTP